LTEASHLRFLLGGCRQSVSEFVGSEVDTFDVVDEFDFLSEVVALDVVDEFDLLAIDRPPT
jgi:hypothetical protein